MLTSPRLVKQPTRRPPFSDWRSPGSTGTADGKVKPDWAGDLLSKVVDAAISSKVLYEGIMKALARRTLINTAEKNGVAWRDIAEELGRPAVKQAFAEIENKSVVPGYVSPALPRVRRG